MATDFAKFAMAKNKNQNDKPFQTLVFLMRDWQNHQEYDFGLIGGSNYLQEVLNIEPTQPKQLQDVRKYISNSFDQRLCFLLPHPGVKVVSNKEYDGRFSELEEEFQIHLEEFLSWLLAPKNLKKKKVLNNEVNGLQYLEYLKLYFETFQSDDIPEIETLHGITVRKQYEIVMSDAILAYKNVPSTVDFKVEEEWKTWSAVEQEINQIHANGLNAAVKVFKDRKKLGSKTDEKKYEKELKQRIQSIFNEWKNQFFDSYKSIKAVEEQKKRELEQLKKDKEEELRRQKERADREKKELELKHQNHTEFLNKTIADVQNKTALEIQNLTNDFKTAQEENERQKKEIMEKMEKEREDIKKKAEEAQKELQSKLEFMQEAIKKKENDSRKKIEEDKEFRLEVMKQEAAERKEQFDRQMLIADQREKALAEQRQFEREQMEKREKIREDSEKADRKAREEGDEKRRLADRLFQQQIQQAQSEAARLDREAKERSDAEFRKLIIDLMTTTTTEKSSSIWDFLG